MIETINNGESGLIVRGKLNENFAELSLGLGEVIEYDASVTDYRALIQTALDNNRIVIIGNDVSEVFPIRRAIYPNDNNIIIIRGTLKQTDAVIQSLTADVALGSTDMEVTDGSAFEIGEYVAASDSNQPAVGGGAGQTRLMSISRKVSNIVGNTLSFTETAYVALVAADSGDCGSANSIFIVDTKTNVRFYGQGIIDGNKANQYDHGFWTETGMEEIFSGGGISVKDSTYIYFDGFKVIDCNLHDITTWGTSYVWANKLILESADNKNWLFYTTSDAFITDCVSDLADYEDGFILYYGNNRVKFSNCSAKENGRLGFGINSTNVDCDLVNCYSYENGQNLYIGLSQRIAINNFHSIGGGELRHNTSVPYRPVDIKNSNNISITNLFVNGCDDAVNELIAVRGDCYNIFINGGEAANTIGITANGIGVQLLASDGFTPVGVVFTNFSFRELKTGVTLINDTVARQIFRDCKFISCTVNVSALRDSGKFYDCEGIVTRNSGIVTMGAAVTSVFGTSGTEGRPDIQRFRAWFVEDGGGNSKVIYCDYVNSNPTNNFRLNVDVAPGADVQIAWLYDHNIGL